MRLNILKLSQKITLVAIAITVPSVSFVIMLVEADHVMAQADFHEYTLLITQADQTLCQQRLLE
jgi:hypothetical protein